MIPLVCETGCQVVLIGYGGFIALTYGIKELIIGLFG